MIMMPSVLVYGFKTSSVEEVREKLELAFAVKLRVFRDDDEGVRYETNSKDAVPSMMLVPNHDADEEGDFFPEEDFKDFPVILRIWGWEKFPEFRDRLNAIPDFGADLLEEMEEEEFDDDDPDGD